MNKFGQQRLPYTSKVEYLQSSNIYGEDAHQQIDPGVLGHQIYGFEIKVTDMSTTHYGSFIGNSTIDDFTFGSLANEQENLMDSFIRIRTSLPLIMLNSGQAKNQLKHLIVKDGQIACNNQKYGEYDSSTPLAKNDNDVFLFYSNIQRCSACKIHFAKIYGKDNVLLRDFIPVRVGNEGFMYDKVTRKFFENVGSGSFILGPDVIGET